MTASKFLPVALGVLFMSDPEAIGETPYARPPAAIKRILDVPPPPSVSLSPTRDRVALIETARYPDIAELAEPILRLAGVRLNPRTNGPAREPRVTGLAFQALDGSAAVAVPMPQGARFSPPDWSPDGAHFALHNTTANALELWVGDAKTGAVQRVEGAALNAALGSPIDWIDADTLLVRLVPPGRGAAPVAPLAPNGPTVQESAGKAAPVRTYQDMLANAHDEALFAYHATGQLATVDRRTLAVTPVGQPAIFAGAEASPDGKFILVSRVVRPFSYLYPYSSFPEVIEVIDRAGKVVRTVANRPLQDQVPIEGVPTGPRGVRWVPTSPATLLWAEAQDGGDPKKGVPHRDALFTLAAPFSEGAKPAGKTVHRYRGASFFEDGSALVTDYDRERRWSQSRKVALDKPDDAGQVVFDRSAQDRYNDPGTPVSKPLRTGQRVIRTVNGKLMLSAGGATPKGEFPFLALYDPATKESKKLFECRPGFYETATALNDDGSKLLVRRESPTEPPNYFVRTGTEETPLTRFPDPFPELRQVKKELVTTKRPDGVTISFTLYTPPGYVPGTKLPTVFWAYPREFNTADTAGQVSGSPNRFVTLGGYSHLFFLTQGYAVMDEVSVPIVGPPETANDTFLDQLVASAKAAIDKGVEMGVVDRGRVGIGGHSYGAFMTANLLAHSDLFRAGIARSGAYNRTLTPFGFQNERRTFWEAPDIYAKMSPFNAADKIRTPLLMIHGVADSNPGTFPVQSERLYQAIRGNGGTVRLVLLPHEDHGYAAKQSIEHVLAESVAWFDKYVKDAPAK